MLDRDESAPVFVQHSTGPSNGYTPRFLGFSLFVSNTTNRLDGILCFKDNDFNISTIPSVFNTTCTVHGQYVIYYNERLEGVTYPDDYSLKAYNGICEVEVYGLYIYIYMYIVLRVPYACNIISMVRIMYSINL